MSILDRNLAAFAAICVIGLMFLPLVVVSIYIANPNEDLSAGAVEATVGVGVILRAIARRLFRAGARNIIRVTFGTMTRAVARTATTRVLRVFFRTVAGSAAKEFVNDEVAGENETTQTAALSLVLGIVGTAISFWGVLAFAEATTTRQLFDELPLSLHEMIFWATIPLVCLAGLCFIGGRIFGASQLLATGFDGLLIQAYFTISGSFLPMTTDFEFRGDQRPCALASVFSLISMMVASIVMRVIGVQSGNDSLIFGSAMFLTYAFVYSFPVQPLLGFSVWSQSRLLWLAVFAPILIAFLVAFPSSLAALL